MKEATRAAYSENAYLADDASSFLGDEHFPYDSGSADPGKHSDESAEDSEVEDSANDSEDSVEDSEAEDSANDGDESAEDSDEDSDQRSATSASLLTDTLMGVFTLDCIVLNCSLGSQYHISVKRILFVGIVVVVIQFQQHQREYYSHVRTTSPVLWRLLQIWPR